MKLKCNINRKKFPIVQGVTFCEEYNETLDSGTIIITHVPKIRNLKPYNDVFVYDNEFNGFYWDNDKKDMVVNGENKFYKHMLVQNFTEEIINLKDGIYSYTISLMSEIKALEKVQLPNISITQPLKKSKKVSIYEYLCRFVELYSPKIKKKNGTRRTWEYQPKYIVDPKLKDIFGDTYSPDFSLNLPSLRDVLSQLMIVKDMIPYVENNVIKAMDITLRKKEFNLDVGHMNYITGTMSADNYCTAVKRTYTDALSQDNTCRSIEKLTFRNSDTALMTIENMRVETRFPIYKINKIYMCYYKKAEVSSHDFDSDEKYFYTMLCRQDITPLVKLNTERVATSKNWLDFNEKPPYDVNTMAENYMCTVGYDIGSKYITGWGEKQTIPLGWWGTKTTSVIENILNFMDYFYPTGINTYDELIEKLTDEEKESMFIEYRKFENEMSHILGVFATGMEDILFESLLNIKGIFFIIDYQGFYNGTVVHSKDLAEDDYITTNDNSSSSLALLEKDGLSQKEKVNRLGNKTLQISARYDNIEDMQDLGNVYNNDDDTDVIIYHREYSIYDNVINVNYFGSKDYVLKNYYTSVFARHRTWNLIPYGESVRRSENRKKYYVLSKNKSYYEQPFDIYFDGDFLNDDILTSAIKPSDGKKTKVNFGYIEHILNNESNYYLAEVSSFTTGSSFCFNVSMTDNISAGTYIEEPSPFKDYTDETDGKKTPFKDFVREVADVKDDFTGSKIGLYKIVDDDDTGYIQKLNFYISSKEDDMNTVSFEKFKRNGIQSFRNHEGIKNYITNIYSEILEYPKIKSDSELLTYTDKIYTSENIYKDNKEIIDMTFQIEVISIDDSVLFSSWFFKLNDMVSNYIKNEQTTRKQNADNSTDSYDSTIELLYSQNSSPEVLFVLLEYLGNVEQKIPTMILNFKENDYNDLKTNFENNIDVYVKTLNTIIGYNRYKNEKFHEDMRKYDIICGVEWEFIQVDNIGKETLVDHDVSKIFDYIDIKVNQTLYWKKAGEIEASIFNSEEVLRFYRLYNNYYNKPGLDFTNNIIFEYCLFKNEGAENAIAYRKLTYTPKNGEPATEFSLLSGTDGTYAKFILETPLSIGLSETVKDNIREVTANSVVMWSKNWDLRAKYYPKNMFIVTSNKIINSGNIYDEYLETDIPYSIHETKISSIISNMSTSSGKKIIIDNRQARTVGKWEFDINKDIVGLIAGETYHAIDFTSNNENFIGIKRAVENDIKKLYFIKSYNNLKEVYNSESNMLLTNYQTIIVNNFKNLTIDYDFISWLENCANKIESEYDVKSIQYWYKDNIKSNGKQGIRFNTVVNTEWFSLQSQEQLFFPVYFRDGSNDYCDGIVFVGNWGHPPTMFYSSVKNGLKRVYDRSLGWTNENYKTLIEICYLYGSSKQIIDNEFLKMFIKENSIILNDENTLKFVFGVNLTNTEKNKDNIEIYTSFISNRDEKVYDENNNVIGKVRNYIENSEDSYGTDQYYDDIIE